MQKISTWIYTHRGYWIIKDEQGIYIDFATVQSLTLYKTLNDARQAINKHIDGTNMKEPVIIGEWMQ